MLQKSPSAEVGPNPIRIAALIPAFNEEPVIHATIDALLAAGCARDDVYVVDDRSTDRTAELARARGVNVYTVPVNGGKARAQAAALRYFRLLDRYEWVVFLDGDTKVDPQFIAQMREAVRQGRPDDALYVGQVCSARNQHLVSAQRAMEYAFAHDLIKQGQSNCNVILVSPGCASMYRSSVLRELHIDDSTLAEDMDLTIQVHRRGLRVRYVAEARVHTQDPATVRDYYKQVLRWHRGFWQIVRKHRIFTLGHRMQWLDAYVMFMVVDFLVFNKIIMGVLIAIAMPWYLPYAIGIDLMIGLAIAIYSSVRTRRPDVLYKFPLYYWISYVNLYAFVSAMVDVIVLRRTKLHWNKVRRYDFDRPHA